MVTGIVLRNCVDVRLDSISMSGVDTGFEIYDSEDIKMRDVELRATHTAVKGERVRGFSAQSITHSEAGWLPRLSPLAIAVWRVTHGDV